MTIERTDGEVDLAFDHRLVLEGTKVRLRPIRDGDVGALHEMACDEETRRLTGTHATFSRHDAERWYRARGTDDDRIDLAIARGDDDTCVGEVVLNDLDPINRSCSFRISLCGAAQFGRGFGTEATRLILSYAFEQVGLHRVELEVYAFNDRARHVYANVGFRLEGVRREALWWDGEFHDAVIMAILAREWHERHPPPASVAGESGAT